MCIYIRVLKRYTHQTSVRWRIFALSFLEELYDAPVRYLPCSLPSYHTQNKFTKSKPKRIIYLLESGLLFSLDRESCTPNSHPDH